MAPKLKNISGYIRVKVPAGKAVPSQSLGPALGQHGLNIMEFCNAFNAATKEMEEGIPIPTIITAYGDRSFDFITKTPPASFLLLRATGVKKGSGLTGREMCGKVTHAQLQEVAGIKMQDLNAFDMEAAVEMVKGTARSMGLEVVE